MVALLSLFAELSFYHRAPHVPPLCLLFRTFQAKKSILPGPGGQSWSIVKARSPKEEAERVQGPCG